MDVYLTADFYRLRDELNDWRDAPTNDLDLWRAATPVHSHPAREETDPQWCVL
ncbi:MAG TPA: hypothetical protein VFB32_10810 [Rudaea sp.]|nr:hypothetical protein [Rudaea sp.]